MKLFFKIFEIKKMLHKRNNTKIYIDKFYLGIFPNYGDPYGIRTRECMRERHVS